MADSLTKQLMGLGIAGGPASLIGADSVTTVPTRSTSTTLTAAGTTIADALLLTSLLNIVTTAAASTGVRLPQVDANFIGQSFTVKNAGANTINIFPFDTSMGFNRGTLGAAVTLASGSVGIYRLTTATNFES